ncbi:carbon-nitrogen hydrolase family protein [Bifidobacterium aquikefiricola]|uniref:Carbon-nitrogen hydrolase family protein n=1 Tax=Bifidobacterium aquikefiricola TaxID=3059038 RepID=A0AB39U5J1_9BIFI
MKKTVGVLENIPELIYGTDGWTKLQQQIERQPVDFLVLNELPFGTWLASSHTFDKSRWEESISISQDALKHLDEFNAENIVGSMPMETADGTRVNAGFLWSRKDGLSIHHYKQHLPHGPGYWETTWTSPGSAGFESFEVSGLKVGFMICTDIMFPEHARQYGRENVDLIVCPRATPPLDQAMFHAALTMAATVSGSYVASSNRGYTDSLGFSYEGNGRVISPRGIDIAVTNPEDSYLVVDIDTDFVRAKQARYPIDVH